MRKPYYWHSPDGETTFDQELFWRDHYAWLKECGYLLLRPRYNPQWVLPLLPFPALVGPYDIHCIPHAPIGTGPWNQRILCAYSNSFLA
jgi:hypothetical protein